MKKIIMMIILFWPVAIFAQVETNVEAVAGQAWGVAQGIIQNGFISWVKNNWLLFFLSVVGLARLIVVLTPTKQDDKFFNKYILNPVNSIAAFLSLQKKK